jgi:hypothetical protein
MNGAKVGITICLMMHADSFPTVFLIIEFCISLSADKMAQAGAS